MTVSVSGYGCAHKIVTSRCHLGSDIKKVVAARMNVDPAEYCLVSPVFKEPLDETLTLQQLDLKDGDTLRIIHK